MTLTIQRYCYTGILKIDTIIVEIPISIVMVKVFLVLGFPDPELKSVGKKIKFDNAAKNFNYDWETNLFVKLNCTRQANFISQSY